MVLCSSSYNPSFFEEILPLFPPLLVDEIQMEISDVFFALSSLMIHQFPEGDYTTFCLSLLLVEFVVIGLFLLPKSKVELRLLFDYLDCTVVLILFIWFTIFLSLFICEEELFLELLGKRFWLRD